jgi:membrane protease YdiL (CAAX protease family)
LRERLGTLPALLIAAAAFALFHFVPGVLLPTFLLGILLGIIFLATRSVIPGMVAHGFYNGLALWLAYWAASQRS